MEKIKLNNGVEMPVIGLGTYLINPKDAQITTREALKMGYRMIDTANAYMNERAVGRGIKEAGVPREEVFVSTKIWATEYNNERAVENTLERLGLDYIDLLFIHQPTKDYMNGYRMIEKAVKEGKVKAIGISNCEGKYIENILANCEIKPQVIQVEAHPYFTQDDLRKVLAKEDIKLMSWYPLGHGDSNLMNEPVFANLAEKYGKTKVQVILRWHIDMGFIVIPGTKNVEHVRENFDILDFKLTDEDMAEIAKINKNERYYNRTDEMLESFATWQPEYEKNNKKEENKVENIKKLVVYYSYTGHTKMIAESIQKKLNCDILEIKPVKEYSKDYNQVVNEEQNNDSSNKKPEIQKIDKDLSNYDEIIVGSPVWWYTIAPVIRTFLAENNLTGKVIKPYATNAGWLGHTFEEVQKLCPNSKVEKGMNIVFTEDYRENSLVTSPDEIDNWISQL